MENIFFNYYLLYKKWLKENQLYCINKVFELSIKMNTWIFE